MAACALILAGAACTPLATPAPVLPAGPPIAAPRYGEPFAIGGGQTVHMTVTPPTLPATSLRLTFLSVVSDERCPAQVQCVYARPPVIVAQVGLGDRPSQDVTLSAGARAQFDGIRVEFIDLSPVPQQPEEFAKLKPLDQYVATMRVSAARVE